MEEVKSVFRSEINEKHLQYHEIETIFESNSAADSQASSEVAAAQVSPGKIFSSKYNPEMCARNTHGQFLKRSSSFRPTPVDLKELAGRSEDFPPGTSLRRRE